MRYKSEFPDFDYTIPDLGKGWEDNSWHNDVCPSMDYPLGGERMIRIWFDYADPSQRECEGGRYTLSIGEYGDMDGVMSTDNLDEILDYIKANRLTESRKNTSFPIDLSNSDEAVFICKWNGDEIIELHTLTSLKAQYGKTNLFDDEEFSHCFGMTFEEYILQMGGGDYHIFDNMRIECIKSGAI